MANENDSEAAPVQKNEKKNVSVIKLKYSSQIVKKQYICIKLLPVAMRFNLPYSYPARDELTTHFAEFRFQNINIINKIRK